MTSAAQNCGDVGPARTARRPEIKKGRNREIPKGTYDHRSHSEEEIWARNVAAAMNGEAYIVDTDLFALIAEVCCVVPAVGTHLKPPGINQELRKCSDEEAQQITNEIEERRSSAQVMLTKRMLQALVERDSRFYRKVADILDRLQSTSVADSNANHILTHYHSLRGRLERLPTADELKQCGDRLPIMDKGQFSRLTKKLGLEFTPKTLLNKLAKMRGKEAGTLAQIRTQLRGCKAAKFLLELSDDDLITKLGAFEYHVPRATLARKG